VTVSIGISAYTDPVHIHCTDSLWANVHSTESISDHGDNGTDHEEDNKIEMLRIVPMCLGMWCVLFVVVLEVFVTMFARVNVVVSVVVSVAVVMAVIKSENMCLCAG